MDQPQKNNILVSVIILDFFKAQKVIKNIASVMNQTIADQVEIIVVDNSENEKNFKILQSYRKTLDEKFLQKIIVKKSSKNIGYTKGNNWAASFASGKYIAVVNPDIFWPEKKTLETLVGQLKKQPDIGIIAPAQKEPDGSWAMSVRRFPNIFIQVARRIFLRHIYPFSKWVAQDEMQKMDRKISQDVDWLQSSCYMLSRKNWDVLGGFDERYFLFLADTQMCKNMWSKKKRVYFYADTMVMSDGLRCSEGGIVAFFTKKSLRIHCIDAVKYFWSNINKTN